MAQVHLERQRAVRLIASARLKPQVMAPLADNHDEMQIIQLVEGLTNDRLASVDGGFLEITRDELVGEGTPGHSFINASFTHPSPYGNRFNGPRRGAWYAGFEVETSLAEITYHLTRELVATGRLETSVDYAELIADFSGSYEDLRGVEADHPCAAEDIAIAYPAGQAIAADVVTSGGLGIVYRSARHPGGTCLVALRPRAIEHFVQGGLWRLTWEGEETPRVTQNPR